MSTCVDQSISPTEKPPVAAKPDKSEEKPRERARNRGLVVPLGVEVSTAHGQALEALCVKMRWTRRTAVEAAIEALAGQQGLWPPASAATEPTATAAGEPDTSPRIRSPSRRHLEAQRLYSPAQRNIAW